MDEEFRPRLFNISASPPLKLYNLKWFDCQVSSERQVMVPKLDAPGAKSSQHQYTISCRFPSPSLLCMPNVYHNRHYEDIVLVFHTRIYYNRRTNITLGTQPAVLIPSVLKSEGANTFSSFNKPWISNCSSVMTTCQHSIIFFKQVQRPVSCLKLTFSKEVLHTDTTMSCCNELRKH